MDMNSLHEVISNCEKCAVEGGIATATVIWIARGIGVDLIGFLATWEIEKLKLKKSKAAEKKAEAAEDVKV